MRVKAEKPVLAALRNTDGQIDVADAVTILRYLFLGTPTEMLPLCEPPPAPSGSLGTGQSACYELDVEQGWVVAPCSEASCPGQDAAYAMGCASERRYLDSRDGTMTDWCTGLMWRKDTAALRAS